MNPIREWLISGKSYHVGVALYECHGSDSRLKKAFAQGHSAFRAAKLEQSLRDLVSAAERPAPITPPVVKTVLTNEAKMPETSVPEKDDPYRDQWIPLYTRMNFLCHQLLEAKDDFERGAMAFEILDLEKRCNVLWEKRDYFTRTGQMPQEENLFKVMEANDMNAMRLSLGNLRSRISKIRKKLQSTPLNEELKSKLERLEANAKDLEKALKDGKAD